MKNAQGYITLFSILVIGAIIVTMATTLLLLGIGSGKSGLVFSQSRQAEQLASACTEEALEQIRSDTNFSGTNNLTFPGGTCIYTVTNTGGQNRTVDASGTSGQTIRRVKVLITSLTPTITVASWQDVGNF